MKDAAYTVANAWNTVTKKTVMYAWHSFWPVIIFINGDEQSGYFEGFCMSGGKNIFLQSSHQ